jgi:hypothetical protein
MITKQIALGLSHGNVFEHKTIKNKNGSPLRCRVNGKTKTWKTRPDEFKIPVKYGMKCCFYITKENANDWQKTCLTHVSY